MFARLLGCAILGVALTTLGLGAQGTTKKDDTKKTDTKKVETKKDDAKRVFNEKAALTGTIKSVNKTKKSFTLTLEKEKKDRTFTVTDATQYFGPRGGDRDETGFMDDCMAAGYGLEVVASTDGKDAKQVRFDTRKGDAKDEKKDEPKKK